MLYVTSRSDTHCYTPYHTLMSDRAPDGGFFLPDGITAMSDVYFRSLRGKTTCEILADVLNRFFFTRLTGWEMEIIVGKKPMTTASAGQKIVAAEMWHGFGKSFDRFAKILYERFIGDTGEPTVWFRIALRIAALFAAYGDMQKTGHVGAFDVSVSAEGFADPVAAVIAKKMGLPIDRILCNGDEGGALWDAIRRGEIGAVLSRDGSCFESLLAETTGRETVDVFLKKTSAGNSYFLPEELLPMLNQDLFAAVVSPRRLDSVITSVYRTDSYLIDRKTAVSISGVRDYRSNSGVSTCTLVFADDLPERSDPIRAEAASSRE